MVELISNDVDFYSEYKKDVRPIIVWGASDWGKLLSDEQILTIECFCDRNSSVEELNGLPVYSIDELKEKYRNRSVYIMNSIGTAEIKEDSVYCSVSSLGLDAKICNVHKNIAFLGNSSFVYQGKKYHLFSHIHNCGFLDERMSERAIEIAIAQKWLENHSDNIIEIGAVTPYYFPNLIQDIVDPADEHYLVSCHKSVFDVDLSGKNVLCISTVEHIGTGEYGVVEERTAYMAIEKILQESKHCLITTPLGENPLVDQYLVDHYQNDMVNVFERNGFGNQWKAIDKTDFDYERMYKHNKMVREIYIRRKLLGANNVNIVIEK